MVKLILGNNGSQYLLIEKGLPIFVKVCGSGMWNKWKPICEDSWWGMVQSLHHFKPLPLPEGLEDLYNEKVLLE